MNAVAKRLRPKPSFHPPTPGVVSPTNSAPAKTGALPGGRALPKSPRPPRRYLTLLGIYE